MTEVKRLPLRAYRSGDLARVSPRPEFAAMAPALDAAMMAGASPPGLAWTLEDGGEVSGVGGVFELWPGRWLAWTWVGEVGFRQRRTVWLACQGALSAARSAGARRLEAHAAWDCRWARRFLERLGFRLEGRARAFGPDGADHAHYALIFERDG